MSKHQTWRSDAVVCPWCGYVHDPADDLEGECFTEDQTVWHCSECENEFECVGHVMWTFTTKRHIPIHVKGLGDEE